MAFCTPTTLDQYRVHVLEPQRHPWARMISDREANFAHAVIHPYNTFVQSIDGIGVALVPRVGLSDFGGLLCERRCRCLILVAHWHEEQVEFFDGLSALPEIVAAVPASFDGIIDLSVCNSESLARALRKARPNLGPIRYSGGSVVYAFWLTFYSALLHKIAATSMNYWDAYESTMRDVLKVARQKPARRWLRRLFSAS